MSIRDIRDRIRQEVIGTQAKKVFLVEGLDDKEAFLILLGRFLPGWEHRWGIAEAGNKPQLMKLLKLEPGWLGLVDRDEWDQAAIDERTATQPNLLVLPRFCLENYLINPIELWQAIPAARQAEVTDGQTAFAAAVQDDLPQYLRHGALWKVVTPLWSGLRALGFKETLASENSVATAQSDTDIQDILRRWDDLLDRNRIFTDFQTQLSSAQAASTEEQFCVWVHGKFFWRNVVNPVMNRLFGQMDEAERRNKILRRLPQPADLQSILDRLR
jgi:hypothetical protein